jgi:hypothetical protein
MATTARRPGVGTFESEYDDLGLYTLVRIVAEFVSPDDPAAVTQAAWDAGRAPSGHPGAPSARAICARLADRDGKPFPWRELLELVFDPSRDVGYTHAQRRGEEEAGHFTEEHVYYALRRVADERDVKTLGPDAYARARQELIAADRRRGVNLLGELLPTVGQIERIVGDWAGALKLAELEPRNGDSWKPPKGVPRRRNHWTLELCVDAVRRYFKQLSSRQAASKKGYLAWSTGHEDAPAPSSFDRYGGWATVSRLARGSGPIPHVPTKAEKIEAAVLAYIDKHGQIMTRDVPALLCVGSTTASTVLKRLKDKGVIAVGSKHATGRSVFYIRGGAGSGHAQH